jgi:hypothetical protein
MKKTILAGLSGGLAMNLMMLLTFRTFGFGWDAKGILLTSPIQSQKLIAVWTKLEPLPLIVNNPLPIIGGLFLFGIGHALLYRHLAVSWPLGFLNRGIRMGGLIFFMTYMFWEFFTPFNQFGEPLPLIALELSFWAAIALAESLTIAFVMERNPSRWSRRRK